MPDVREYEGSDGISPFGRWFADVESRAAAKVTRTVAKLEAGLRPDVKPVGQGVFEARINFGPGYRLYFGLDGETLVILLGGGDKRTQQKDITAAQVCWADYKTRKEGIQNAVDPQLQGNRRGTRPA